MSALMHAFFLVFFKVSMSALLLVHVCGPFLVCSRVSAFCLVGVGWAGRGLGWVGEVGLSVLESRKFLELNARVCQVHFSHGLAPSFHRRSVSSASCAAEWLLVASAAGTSFLVLPPSPRLWRFRRVTLGASN